MTQGIESVWELPGSRGGITLEVAVSEQYDTLANTSSLQVGLRVKSSRYYQYTYYLKGSLTLEGTELVKMDSTIPTHYVQLPALNTYDAVKKWSAAYTDSPWTLESIPHAVDGSKTVSLSIQLKGYTGDGSGGSGWSVATTLEIPLTHIPRASTLSASDGDIGGRSILTVTRRSPAYTHSICYRFGTLGAYLRPDGTAAEEELKFSDTAIAFALPHQFLSQMPDCATMPCQLICTTYLGDTRIGQQQTAVFQVTVPPQQFGPGVSGMVEDRNPATLALTGDSAVLVRHMSRAQCTAAAQPGPEAGIAGLSVNGVEMAEGTLTAVFPEIGTNTFHFCVTDSRGYSARQVVTAPMIPYVKPAANLQAVRLEPTGDQVAVTVSGVCFTGSFGPVNNSIAVSVSVNDGAAVTVPVTAEENTFRSRQLLTGLDYRRSHTVTVTVTDRLNTVSKTVTVEKGLPVFDWGPEDFRFHVPVTAPALNGHANIALAAYPVGAIFAAAEALDPGTVLGGRWEPLETDLPFSLWKRTPDDGAKLGAAILGLMKLGR